MKILRKLQTLKKPEKQHQAAVTATMMFLKKVWTLQVKGGKQLTDLAETINFLSETFHEFEADRKLKDEIIKSLHGQVSVLHDDF